MFRSKKKTRIHDYLNNIPEDARSPFDCLLADWMEGRMKARIRNLGVQRIDLYIDWNDGYKCIGIQGLIGKRYLDMQIEPGEFSYACDDIEPDDHIFLPLQSSEQPYKVIAQLAST